jgi:tetratricopeptide (TPR) repeat protein
VAELPDLSSHGVFDERLREVASDPAAVERALAAGRRALAETREPREEARLHGYVGNALRMLGLHEEAIGAQAFALALVEELGDARGVAVARIRLGEALRCAGELERAEAELRTALASARARPELALMDFALQHLGKTLLDAGRAREAEPLLAEALALRENKGDAALVQSTRLALDRARATQ